MTGDSAPGRRLRVVLVCGLLAAGVIAVLVGSGVSHGADLAWMRYASTVYLAMPPWGREALRDLTALGSGVILSATVVFAAVYLAAARRLHLAALLVASAAGATAASTAFKHIVDRARPSLMEEQVPTFTASFPSGHALLTAAIILPMAVLLARTMSCPRRRRTVVGAALVTVGAVGLSRIVLGVHWPTDVAAGWSFGIAWAAATLMAAEHFALQRQKHEA